MMASDSSGSTSPDAMSIDISTDDSDDNNIDQNGFNNYKLRHYQRKLFEKSINKNIIVCLPTGTGKTLIAITLIKNKLYQTDGDFPATAKRTVFLAPTKVLVEQQFKTICEKVPASVGRLHGDKQVDLYSLEEWNTHWQKNKIIVFTPQVLVDILIKGFIKITNFNLIIFDEAHWALKKKNKPSSHPYRRLMDIFKEQTKELRDEEKPRIMGLSASILNPQLKIHEFDKTIDEIQEIYEATVESDYTKEYFKEAKVFVEISDNSQFTTNLLMSKNNISGSDHAETFDKILGMFNEMMNEKKDIQASPLVKSLCSAIEKVKKLCYSQMGPWFAIEALKLYIKSFSSKTMLELNATLTNLFEYMQKQIELHFRTPLMTDGEFALKGRHSEKILVLLKFLTIFRQHLNCIVFVTERVDANIIYRWLLFISENVPEYSFLKPGFICGSQSKDFIRFDKNTDDFKNKFEKKELNVMIATSVLEEGIDVPICNIVIRYDFPVNFRAFTQSKGRARDADSYYLLMVDDKNEQQKWRQQLDDYYKIEERLKNISARSQARSPSDDSADLEDPFAVYQRFKTKNGAELNEKDSLRILHQYLQRLPSDYFTESRPNFIELRNQNELLRKYCCLFILPINSSLIGIVKGEYRPNKAAAKLNCSFKVCQLLYEKGEIDDHLQIISKAFLLGKHFNELNLKIADRSKDDYEDDLNISKATYTRVSSHYCDQLLSSSVDIHPSSLSTKFYLYMIEFPNSYALFGEPKLDASLRIGILAQNQLPFTKTDSFIYLNQNRIKFRILFNQSYCFQSNDPKMRMVKYFHQHVIQHVIVRHRRPKPNPDDPLPEQPISLLEVIPDSLPNFFLVPIKRKNNQCTIHFELIDQLHSWQSQMDEFHQRRKKCKLTEQTVDQLKDIFPKDSLFASFHKNKIIFLTVKDISADVLPSTEFVWTRKNEGEDGKPKKEDITGNYVQFYKEMYDFTIEHTNVPMIHAGLIEASIRRKWKFAITYKIPKKDKFQTLTEEKPQEDISAETLTEAEPKKAPHQQYPPEFALKYPLTLSYFMMLNSFPPILYRLEQYFIAHEFLQHLCSQESPFADLVYEKEIKTETLFTAKSYQNQSNHKVDEMDEDNDEMDEDLSSNSIDPKEVREYKLVDIDQIESKDVTVATNLTEQKIVAMLPMVLSNFPKTSPKKDPRDDEYLDELLEKLRAVIPLVRISKYDTVSFRQIEETESLQYGDTSLYLFTGNIDEHIDIHFDTFDFVKYPNPWYVVKAFTLAKASDIWNLEQLETVGDAFLKMTTATFLYFKYMSYDEGKLSQLKTALVCNENLYKLALEKDLQKYITSLPLNVGENWIVPFYMPPTGVTLFKDGTKHKLDQELKYKNIADAVEALIGAFLVYGSAGSALCFFRWIGLPAFDPTKDRGEDIDPIKYYQKRFETNFDNIDFDDESAEDRERIVKFKADINKMVDESYRFCFLKNVEEVIKYSFKHKYFLVQAFTHPSFTTIEYSDQLNYISSYQRLEFIGDAILDYVITYFVYTKNPQMSPFQITLLRTALVNNTFYASIVVKYNLHKYLRYYNQQLANSISKFVKKYKCQLLKQLDQLINSSIGEQESTGIDEIDVPKALADIFEALVGAIYIDNGFNLDELWKVVYRMIKVELDYFLQNIPTNPLAWLEKVYVNRYEFGPQVPLTEIKRKIELTIKEIDGSTRTFSGYGQTKRQCKLSAAKRAMTACRSGDSTENRASLLSDGNRSD